MVYNEDGDYIVVCLLYCTIRHGLYRSEILIYGDPTLSFKETVPTSTLFTEPPIKEPGGEYTIVYNVYVYNIVYFNYILYLNTSSNIYSD